MVQMDRTAILIAEYSEAGAACRAHEANVRAALGAYIAASVAFMAIAWTVPLSSHPAIVIFVFGFGIGVVVVTVILRHRSYYYSYMARAQEIEIELGMVLHTRAWTDVKGSGSSNKYAYAWIASLFSIYFLIGAFYFAFRGR